MDATSTLPEIVFELRFALVQHLQTQLPAMQLDRELIDVAGDLSALRFVLFQFAANLIRVRERACIWLFNLRNRCLLSAFLAGQIQPRGRSIRDERCFAMLAVKENIGISRDFAHRVHPQ